MNPINRLEIIFFANKNGVEPVREWLKNLSKDDKKALGEDIKTVQFGWPLGMPLIDSLGNGLWEIRTKLPSARIARVIFFMCNRSMVLVHSFIKKTQKTPKQELDLASKRKKQFELGET